MTQENFVNRREKTWKEFEETVRGGRKSLKSNASGFPAGYREISQDLNTAKANGYDPSLIERLNSLVLEGNQILYSRRSWSWKTAADFFIRVFPSAVRSQWKSLGVSFLIFYGLGFFFGFLVIQNPSMIYQLVGGSTVYSIERM